LWRAKNRPFGRPSAPMSPCHDRGGTGPALANPSPYEPTRYCVGAPPAGGVAGAVVVGCGSVDGAAGGAASLLLALAPAVSLAWVSLACPEAVVLASAVG